MKRPISVLAVITGLLGTMLTGISPASASTIDCSTGGYTRVLESYALTNHPGGAIDGRIYNISGSVAHTYEICLDIPDTSTFTIEVIRFPGGEPQIVFVDDRPGDKIFRYTPGANSAWQVHGTITGPGSTYLYYTWHEKQIPA